MITLNGMIFTQIGNRIYVLAIRARDNTVGHSPGQQLLVFAGDFSALTVLSTTFESFLPPLDCDTVIRQP